MKIIQISLCVILVGQVAKARPKGLHWPALTPLAKYKSFCGILNGFGRSPAIMKVLKDPVKMKDLGMKLSENAKLAKIHDVTQEIQSYLSS